MRIRRSAVPAALAGVALVLTGCSGGGAGELTYEDSPLSAYWGASADSGLSEEEQQRKADEQNKEVEELVAKCMSDEGFEYTPEANSGVMITSGDDVVWEPDSKEWVAQWGYGAVNNPYQEQMEQQIEDAEEPAESPNQKYVESLSESESMAYQEALYGPSIPEDELNEDGSYEYSWEDSGCYGAAQHEVYGESVYDTGEFDDLMERMSSVYDDLAKDSAMVALEKEWSTCMADAGQSGFATQQSAQDSIYEEQNKLWETVYQDNPDGDVDVTDIPEIKELAEKEVALALVDLDCREKTNYRSEALKIQFALEEQFIQQNKAELDRYKAAVEQEG